MMRALYTGASGMKGQQFRIDVTANNIANVNTTGFKRDRAEFQDLIYQNLRVPGATSATGTQFPTGLMVGLGTHPVATFKMFFQGPLVETQNPLDLAIEGDGFFQVLLPDGTIGYTRDGSFKIDGQGNVVTNEGFFLEPPLTVPTNAVELVITPDGVVNVRLPGEPNLTQIGQIETVRFINPAGLQPVGRNIFQETDASGPPQLGQPGLDGHGFVRQGFLEQSNVQIVDEMIDLITGQRAFETNSKSVQVSDQVLGIANELKR